MNALLTELGRITRKTETLEGVTQVSDYRYDLAGRLTKVTDPAKIVTTYAYDGLTTTVTPSNSRAVN